MKPIHHRSWISKELCSTIYLPEYDGDPAGQEAPPSGIIYCPLDQIVDFFKLCETTDNKYTVVSACSDYGLHLQEIDPVEKDMQKWLPMQDVTGIGYSPAVIPPRCNVDRCKIADNFAVKMYSFTRDTFDSVPKNVVYWYSTNINVNPSHLPCIVQSIPFGIGNADVDIMSFRIPLEDKTDMIYCNWTNNTNERSEIKKHYKNHHLTLMASGRPYEEYLKELASCKFCMCPDGNGLDSYRILEALYVGTIPIIHKDYWSEWMSELPVILCDHRGIPSDQELTDFLASINPKDFDNVMLDFDFWFKHIKGGV